MPSSAEILAALCALLACACNSGPEVVATQRQTEARDASTYLHVEKFSECEAGEYSGDFTTVARADASLGFSLKGPIKFSLVKEPTGSGEFLTLADSAPLTGHSDSLSATFTATIRGGANCVDGAFQTQLDDGTFSISGGSVVTFAGTVSGTYFSDQHAFAGEWNVLINGGPAQTGGVWTALLAR